jgi:WhiB family redox-sensing transcriptional regulator
MTARVSRIAQSTGAAGPLLHDLPWQARAACASVDPELFWPATDATPAGQAQIRRAIAVCDRCPVVSECLQEALASPFGQHGVWAGMTEDERTYLLRRRPELVPAPAARDERCPSGQVHAEADTYTESSGKVRCRICRRASERRRDVNRRAAA